MDRYPRMQDANSILSWLGAGGTGPPQQMNYPMQAQNSAQQIQQTMAPATNNPAASGFGGTGTAGARGAAGGMGLSREALDQYIYDNPEFMIPHSVPGIDPMGPGFNRLADLPFDPFLLYSMAQYGAGGGVAGGGPDQYANFLNQLYSGVAGGDWIDFNSVLGMLNGGGPQSQLGQWLNNADPGQVMGFLKSVLGTAAQGLDPFGQNVVYTMMPGMFAQQGADLLGSTAATRGNINPLDAFNRGLASLGM